MTPDVNVLVAASRSDHPHHKVALRWLEGAVAEAAAGRGLLLLPLVVASFLRLVTHPKVFVAPTPIADAVGFVLYARSPRPGRGPCGGLEARRR